MRRPLLAALATLTLAGCAPAPAPPKPTTGPPTSSAPTKSTKPLPASMAALGDSITRGVNACEDRLGDCPDASWATGTVVPSHAQRIGQKATNLASSGARVSALPEQADAAVALKPAYITILIGANDACRQNMTEVSAYKADLTAALRKIKQGVPEAKLLLVSVPDLYQLWQIGHADPKAVGRWGFGICPSMLDNPTSTAAADEQRRQRVRARVVAYNEVLKVACQAYGPNCRTDNNAVFGFQFKVAHVSAIDYFHPSALGQAELARLTNDVGWQW